MNPSLAKGDPLEGLSNPFEGLDSDQRKELASLNRTKSAIKTLGSISKAKVKEKLKTLNDDEKAYFIGWGIISHSFIIIIIIIIIHHHYQEKKD